MELTLPDDLLRGLSMTEEQGRLHFAIGLYLDQRVTLGRAAAIGGVSKPAFLDELGKRRIPVNYDIADLETDLGTLAKINRTSSP